MSGGRQQGSRSITGRLRRSLIEAFRPAEIVTGLPLIRGSAISHFRIFFGWWGMAKQISGLTWRRAARIWIALAIIATPINLYIYFAMSHETVPAAKSLGAAPPPMPSDRPTTAAAYDLPYLHALPVTLSTAGPVSRRSLSPDSLLLKKYWLALEGFKHDPKFHVLGFDNPFEYGEWRGKVEALSDRAGKVILRETGVSPEELASLGDDYLRNKGRANEHSDFIVAKLDAALNPKPVQSGQGRVTNDTQGCSDILPLARSMRELEEGQFEASNASLDQARCITVPANAVTTLPTKRAGYDWLKDKGQHVFVLVRIDQRDLWVPEDSISFKIK